MYHTYPGAHYYDLCRKCAVEHGLEDEEHDWRIERKEN
jgi:hypothetical protein